MNISAFRGKSRYKLWLYVVLSLIHLQSIDFVSALEVAEVAEEDELENRFALYSGNNAYELMALCKDFDNDEDFIDVPGKDERQCKPEKKCIPQCDEERIERLQDAQARVKRMIEVLSDPNRSTFPFIFFFTVLFQGVYLIIMKHFNWRTLPFIPGYDMYVKDPTDGYRYRHFMWMNWVILDSDHPAYYHKMDADSQELEYEPQNLEWEDPEAGSDEEIHLPWSVTDILDMTADPDERLEIYFRRIQQKYNLNKPPRHMKKLKNPQKRK